MKKAIECKLKTTGIVWTFEKDVVCKLLSRNLSVMNIKYRRAHA